MSPPVHRCQRCLRLLTIPVVTACEPLDHVPVSEVLLLISVNVDCAVVVGSSTAAMRPVTQAESIAVAVIEASLA